MLDLETQLHRYAEHLETRVPDITADEILGDTGRPTVLSPARRHRRPLLVAAVAAIAVLVLTGGVALLTRIGGVRPPVVTTPEPPPTIQTLPSEWPLGVIIAGESGIAVVPFDSPDEPILLRTDDLFRGTVWADYDDVFLVLSDHRGGLVLGQWPPLDPGGPALWLRAGASTPEVLLDPGPGTHQVIGMATSAEGHALLVYAVNSGRGDIRRSRIMVADLDDGGSIRQLAELDGTVDPNFGRYWLSAGGGVVVTFEDRDESDCFAVTVLSVDDGSHVPAGIDCIAKEGMGPWPMASHDGRSLAVRRESTVTVIDLASGETLEEATIGTWNDRIVSSPGGWLVAIGTETEIRLMGLDGVERRRIHLAGLGTLLAGSSFFSDFYHHPLVLAPATTTAIGDRDGLVWSKVYVDDTPRPLGELRMNAVVEGGPGLVAVGGPAHFDGRQAAVWTSTDGLVWSRVPHDESVFGGHEMRAVVAGGPGLVAVGSTRPLEGPHSAAVWTSIDGLEWSRVPHDEEVFGGDGSQVMNAVVVGGPGLVAVGRAGYDGFGGGSAAVWTSVDGLEWARVPHDDDVFGGQVGPRMNAVVAGGPGLVAVGSVVWTSVDGLAWSRASALDGDDLLELHSVVAYGPGLVAVGTDGRRAAAVWTSTDGLEWLQVPHDESVFGGPSIHQMTAVAPGGPGLVAVGLEIERWLAAVWTSTDGLVWSQVPHDESIFGGFLQGHEMRAVVAWGPGLVVVGSDDVGAAVWQGTPQD